MRIILASGSPRRKELLNLITNNFEVIVSNSEEIFKEGLTLEEQSMDVAFQKAEAVFNETEGDRIVIGSDTIVVQDNTIYGKPKDTKDAFEILNKLQNSTHDVITSICILICKNGKIEKHIDYDVNKVYVGKMTEKEINDWINTGKAMDKAGGYAIQEEYARFIEKIDGNYMSIMGLPVNKVYNILKEYI